MIIDIQNYTSFDSKNNNVGDFSADFFEFDGIIFYLVGSWIAPLKALQQLGRFDTDGFNEVTWWVLIPTALLQVFFYFFLEKIHRTFYEQPPVVEPQDKQV